MMTAIAIILFCIFTVGFTGNSIILLVLLRNRRDWQSCTIFLFNLAVADTVFLLSVPFWGLYYLHGLNWQFGEISCKLMSGITSVNMYGSIFFITAMSIDRWAAVVHPHTLGLKRTRRIVICTCYGIWIAAGILSVPRYVFQVTKTITIKNVSLNITSVGLPLTDNLATVPNSMVSSKTTTTQWSGSPQSVTQCILAVPEAYSMRLTHGLLAFLNGTIGFVLPFTVISICYAKIVITVNKKLISNPARKDQIAKLAGAIVAVFFVCWLPNQIMNLLAAFTWWCSLKFFPKKIFDQIYPYTICLAWANSCLNPLLYGYFNKTLQVSFKPCSQKATSPQVNRVQPPKAETTKLINFNHI
ncbi:type-1 angiotensin II receptor B-like [Clavelina lepadiformis]|uniref:type-1 angiotensin II receptor B-like n=1 Tax=Clavelina lepadiformis TaxID=159417 RepID=UPI004041D505